MTVDRAKHRTGSHRVVRERDDYALACADPDTAPIRLAGPSAAIPRPRVAPESSGADGQLSGRPTPRSAAPPKPGLPHGGVAEQVGNVGYTGPLEASDLNVAAAAEGDRVAFAAIYDRYSSRLYDFAVGMLRDRDTAADVVQDTFCIAATRLHQLRGPDKIRPWLYSIVRHEALRRIKARGREQAVDEVPEQASDDHGPEALVARGELAALIADAGGGLSERDRAVLELHYRHGLDGPELADALGVSHTNANTMVGRLRTTIERSLGALLVARHARRHPGECPDLDTVLDGWDGQLTVLMRKRIARHLEGCVPCQGHRAEMVNPRALLGTLPAILPAPLWLRPHVLHNAGTALSAAAGQGVASAAASTSGTHAAHAAAAGPTALPPAGHAGRSGWWPRSGHRLPRPRARHLASLGGGVGAVGAAVTTVVVLTGHPTPTTTPHPVAPIAAAAPAPITVRPGTVVQHNTVTVAAPPTTATGSTTTQAAVPVTVSGAPVTVAAPPTTVRNPASTVTVTRAVPGPTSTVTVTKQPGKGLPKCVAHPEEC